MKIQLKQVFGWLETDFSTFHLSSTRTNQRTCCISLDMSRLMQQVRDQVFDKKVESWPKTCRKPARTCRKPNRKPGFRPSLQLATIMECSPALLTGIVPVISSLTVVVKLRIWLRFESISSKSAISGFGAKCKKFNVQLIWKFILGVTKCLDNIYCDCATGYCEYSESWAHHFHSTEQSNKILSYRKQIARKLRIQYVEGIYSNLVTLKSVLEVTQSHWNWCHSKALARFLIHLP